jgi:hypothetical protein
MGKRRLLVIGSQCDALKPPSSFLPEAAKKLYEVMVDSALSECMAALPSGGLLLDPSVKQVKDALRSAFELASQNDDTLLLAFERDIAALRRFTGAWAQLTRSGAPRVPVCGVLFGPCCSRVAWNRRCRGSCVAT